MVKETKQYTVTKLAKSRFVGVADAARGLRVRPQAIYMVLAGYKQALGQKKLARLVIVDTTEQATH